MRLPIHAALLIAALPAAVASADSYAESTARPPVSNTLYSQPDIRLDGYDSIVIEGIALEYDSESLYRDENSKRRERISAAGTQALARAVGGRFAIVTEAGAGALRLRASITDVRAEKERRRFWQYTPVGLIKGGVDAARGANVQLQSATLHIELLDAMTGEVLATVVDADDYASWQDVVARLDWWVRHIVDDPGRWA
jgi:hypothetical protein